MKRKITGCKPLACNAKEVRSINEERRLEEGAGTKLHVAWQEETCCYCGVSVWATLRLEWFCFQIFTPGHSAPLSNDRDLIILTADCVQTLGAGALGPRMGESARSTPLAGVLVIGPLHDVPPPKNWVLLRGPGTDRWAKDVLHRNLFQALKGIMASAAVSAFDTWENSPKATTP